MSEPQTPTLPEFSKQGGNLIQLQGPTHEPGQSSQGGPDLAVERTYLAHERTLMAWARTSTSLISFGFAIYKFFGGLGERRQHRPLGYITFSTVMISIGLVALLLATLQHWRDTKQLESRFHVKPRYLTPLIAGLIAGLGILGLAAVAFRQ
jgi:putative membrane protein